MCMGLLSRGKVDLLFSLKLLFPFPMFPFPSSHPTLTNYLLLYVFFIVTKEHCPHNLIVPLPWFTVRLGCFLITNVFQWRKRMENVFGDFSQKVQFYSHFRRASSFPRVLCSPHYLWQAANVASHHLF